MLEARDLIDQALQAINAADPRRALRLLGQAERHCDKDFNLYYLRWAACSMTDDLPGARAARARAIELMGPDTDPEVRRQSLG